MGKKRPRTSRDVRNVHFDDRRETPPEPEVAYPDDEQDEGQDAPGDGGLIAPAASETELARPDEYENPLLYLDDDIQGDPFLLHVVRPPDLDRCQCEWKDTTVESFGPKPLVRCEQEPTVVAFQKRDPNDDGPTGAISLCDDHRTLIEHLYPHQCYFRRITTDHKIGDFA